MGKKYVTAYRCLLCGEVVTGTTHVDGRDVAAFCGQVLNRLQKTESCGSVPAHILHGCKDGSYGIAPMSGVVEAPDET